MKTKENLSPDCFVYPGFKAEEVLEFLGHYKAHPELKLKEIQGNPPQELRNFMKIDFIDPTLDVKVLDVPAPVKLGECKSVLVTVPKPRDEANDCGDIHMKFISEHYLKIAGIMLYIPNHWRRGDFLVRGEARCAVTRHFTVRPESLGQEIVANIEILKNSNGSISINIIEDVGVEQSEFKISMPPAAATDQESPTLFLIPGTKNCIKLVPSVKKLEKLNQSF